MTLFDFAGLENLEDIAKELGCEKSFLQYILERPSTFYTQLSIPKKRRSEHRIVYLVDDDLKNLHKNILVAIAAKVDFPEYVQGFISGRSIVTHASLHLGRKYILNIDIKNFFESIKIDQVSEVFEKRLGCSQSVASIFAKLCTLNGCLVQGANTSPILANLVCAELDEQLMQLAQEYGCSYSRYADDITFSGEEIPKKKKISKCLKNYGFQLNPEKYKCQSRGQPQYVTGLTVFDDLMPRIPRKVKKQLRQVLYYINKYGLENHLDRIADPDKKSLDLGICLDIIDAYANKIDGLISFIYSVEPKCAYQFDLTWQEIRRKENREPFRDPSKVLAKQQKKRNLDDSNFMKSNIQDIGKNTNITLPYLENI